MVCPILSIKYYFEDCHKEECAWYNKNCGKCAIVTLAENSESVSEATASQRTIFVREV